MKTTDILIMIGSAASFSLALAWLTLKRLLPPCQGSGVNHSSKGLRPWLITVASPGLGIGQRVKLFTRIRRSWRWAYLLPIGMQRLAGFLSGAGTKGTQGEHLVQFANIGEGTDEHGVKSYIPDAGTTSRYLLYKVGSTADNCALAGAADIPLGPSDDLADANNLDLPIAVKLLGAIKGTTRMISDGTVINGDFVAAAANGQVTSIRAAGSGTYYQVGRAIIPSDATSAAGDAIAVAPCLPVKVTQ